MRVAVVDDEPLARSRLRRLLATQNIDVAAEGENGNEAIVIAEDKSIDLIFMDINMPVKNGLQAAQEIEQNSQTPPAIIFCTAYDQFAIQAFKTNAIAYLLKPFSESELVDALAKATKVSRTQLEKITSQQDSKISLKVGGGIQVVNIDDVSYFHSEDKCVFANLPDKEPIFVDKSLKQLEDEYTGLFIRTHRNSLVNTQHIARVFRDDSGHAFIELIGSKQTVAISRRHFSEVKKWLI